MRGTANLNDRLAAVNVANPGESVDAILDRACILQGLDPGCDPSLAAIVNVLWAPDLETWDLMAAIGAGSETGSVAIDLSDAHLSRLSVKAIANAEAVRERTLGAGSIQLLMGLLAATPYGPGILASVGVPPERAREFLRALHDARADQARGEGR
jgi:hypothetical protein